MNPNQGWTISQIHQQAAFLRELLSDAEIKCEDFNDVYDEILAADLPRARKDELFAAADALADGAYSRISTRYANWLALSDEVV